MKTVLPLCWLCILVSTYSPAQGQIASSQLPKLTAEQWRVRRIGVANFVPLRIYGGKLYDLTEVIIMHRRGVNYPLSFFAYGHVQQIVPAGILLRTWPDDEVYLVRNHPKQATLVDGEKLWVFAFRTTDRYQYKSVSGATRTISVYDWGKPFAGSGKEFKVVTRVCSDASNFQVVWFEP